MPADEPRLSRSVRHQSSQTPLLKRQNGNYKWQDNKGQVSIRTKAPLSHTPTQRTLGEGKAAARRTSARTRAREAPRVRAVLKSTGAEPGARGNPAPTT